MKACNDLFILKAEDAYKGSTDWRTTLESLVMLIGPFAPHTAEELWHDLGHSDSVHTDHWPLWDKTYIVSDTMSIAVQINGKLRGEVVVASDAEQETITAAAKQVEKVQPFIVGQTIVKEIYVQGRLVNFVVKP
jgi:leucyl-tRNA synthetase